MKLHQRLQLVADKILEGSLTQPEAALLIRAEVEIAHRLEDNHGQLCENIQRLQLHVEACAPLLGQILNAAGERPVCDVDGAVTTTG